MSNEDDQNDTHDAANEADQTSPFKTGQGPYEYRNTKSGIGFGGPMFDGMSPRERDNFRKQMEEGGLPTDEQLARMLGLDPEQIDDEDGTFPSSHDLTVLVQGPDVLADLMEQGGGTLASIVGQVRAFMADPEKVRRSYSESHGAVVLEITNATPGGMQFVSAMMLDESGLINHWTRQDDGRYYFYFSVLH